MRDPESLAKEKNLSTVCNVVEILFDPIGFSTHVRRKPVLYYCLLRSCKTSKQHSLLH